MKMTMLFAFGAMVMGAGVLQGAAAPTQYVHETKTVKAGDKLIFRLAPGGGFAVKFVR